MKKFSNEDIAAYYDQTEVHLKRGWDLEKSQAIHYGYWGDGTRSFRQSLRRMNEELARFGKLTAAAAVLDAGCGVGGSAIFLSKKFGCRVTGISISKKQIANARANVSRENLGHLVHFEVKDYTQTGFPDASFDVIWAIESVIHAPEKQLFVDEVFRILKPGGRLVMADLFRREAPLDEAENHIVRKWLDPVAITEVLPPSAFEKMLLRTGMSRPEFLNITPHIRHSARRQYLGSFVLRFFGKIYRLYNPKVSRFADSHHQYGRYQFVALKMGLWNYFFVASQKPSDRP